MLHKNFWIKTAALALLFCLSGPLARTCEAQIEAADRGFSWESHIEHIFGESGLSSRPEIVRYNEVTGPERAAFLNRDFGTRAFDRYNVVKAADLRVDEGSAGAYHLGLIEVGFNRCGDLDRAYRAVTASKRRNFKVKVRTIFTLLRLNHSMVFLYSETPDAPPVRALIKKAEDYSKGKTACQPPRKGRADRPAR
ncbi:MAG TPA: hypothetical protein VE262_18930 [Blastocatellia bacterium]|nr:hypothetical protein [Blastocatellia bacterium]